MYVVRIHCGGARESFLLSDKAGEDNFITQEFDTKEDAIEAGNRSACVTAMGWHFDVELKAEASPQLEN